jgi:NAD/NADP transhydrogenase beta subunit
LLVGFIKAESAVMGRRSGCEGMDMSMITTLFCGDVSRTQMNLSDSIVTCVKVMNCWLMPRLVSVSASFIVMGALAVAMATEDNERDAQYKLSLSRSKLRPRTEKGRSAANPHLRTPRIFDRSMDGIDPEQL